MGKQINFYLLKEDEQELLASISELYSNVIFHSHSKSNQPEIANINDDGLFCDIADPKNAGKILLREIKEQGCWVIDELRSPVIEFTRSFCDGQEITRGRFYFNKEYYIGEKLEQKPKEFIEWADNIFKQIKRILIKYENGNYYIGEKAKAAIESGKLLAKE